MLSLEVVDVIGAGSASEYLRLQATADIPDLSKYVVMDSTYDDDQEGGFLSDKERHVYWFSSYDAVKQGDIVQLATGPGRGPVEPFESSGRKIHTFYWGIRGKTVWNKGGDKAVILFLEDWKGKGVRIHSV